MKFKIIEGESTPDKYERFVQYYNEGLSYKEMIAKGINNNMIRKLRKEAIQKGDVKQRLRRRRNRVQVVPETYKKFIELYNTGVTITKIKEELNFNTEWEYEKYRNRAVQKKDIQLRPIGRRREKLNEHVK